MWNAVLNFRYRPKTLLSFLSSNTNSFNAETPGISKPCDTDMNTNRDKATVSLNHIQRTEFLSQIVRT